VKPTRVLVRGAIAGAVGTAAMDLVWFFRYRRGGGHEGLFAWETATLSVKEVRHVVPR
jgi:hypothetical protein